MNDDDRTRLATLLAAAIVACASGEWENASVAESAWDLLQVVEAEGKRRGSAHCLNPDCTHAPGAACNPLNRHKKMGDTAR